MPPDILEFQRDFAAAIDAPATGALAVYRNTVLHGAVEALRGNYPVIEQLIGIEMFEQVAVDFAIECPPRRPTLALYGSRFADWLGQQSWVGELPYLPDVARVERLHVEALLATDAEPIPRDLAREACRVAGQRLALHPAVRFAWLSTPAMTIWLAHQGRTPRELAPEWKPEGALFARPTPFLLHAPRLGAAGHRMLCGIRIGESVGECISAAARLYPQEDCTAVFLSLINLGAFVAPPIERKN